jgi:hypothetical protein
MIVAAIPFDLAVYCADCHLVVECVAHRCPICQQTAVVNLARMVEGDPRFVAPTKLLEVKP